MSRPLLLDLFCGAGGAAMGYHRAGFNVVGVDIDLQKHYPFDFLQGDATDPEIWNQATGGRKPHVIHASPPCQRYSQSTNMHDKDVYLDLVPRMRYLFRRLPTSVLWVIENVPGAPLRDPVVLCGSAFGIERLRRHRHFESNVRLVGTECDHGFQRDLLSVTGHGEGGSHRGGSKRGAWWGQEERKKAMGVDWMNREELAEAIPPVFSEYIGRQLASHLGVV